MATANDTATGVKESGSTVVFDNICQPCENDGKLLEAEGRCEDCDEYLCKPCFLGHTLPSKMRHHVMTGKDQMIKNGTRDRKDRSTQWCSQHDDEIIKYYCPTHSFLGCSACMILNHKSCSGTIYIPEVAKDLLSSEEYSNYKTSKSAFETQSQEITTDAKERKKTINICQPPAVEKLRSFKKEIIDLFESAEKIIIEESEKEKEKELKKQDSILDTTVVLEKELSALTSPVESFESMQQYCNMYIAIMRAKDDIKSCGKKLGELDQRSEPRREFHFLPNRSIIAEMLSCRGIGKIKDGITQVQHERDVNVKTQSDTRTCWISSSVVLPNNKLIITDYQNDKLKMIDTIQDKVVEELSMLVPWDVTAISASEVVVTLPTKKKIAFVKTDGKLVNDRNIDVVGECRAVAYRENTLVVTYNNPTKIEEMDMQGVVLRTLAGDDEMAVKMKSPLYAVVHSVNKSIYISDHTVGKVVRITSDGTLKSTYPDKNPFWPLGMTVDSFGYVYVCDLTNHIHQITEDCKKKRILLTENDVTHPYAITYCEDEGKFYIGMKDNDKVKVFKVV